MKGGYVAMRHNQIRDLIIHFLIESGWKDIVREPHHLPLTGETFPLRSINTSQEDRLDIAIRGVHNSMEKTFCDVRVFHSGAVSNQCQTVEASFKKHEDEKKRTYNARVIEVEKATFTPLVFSTAGGIGEEANHFMKRVATLISYKKGNLYSDCVSYIRRKLSFCLIRTVLVSVRGYRGRDVISENINSDINLIEIQKVSY